MSDIDILAVNTIRTFCPDIVQKANSGHPGAPMGMAPMVGILLLQAHTLWSRFLNYSSADPLWVIVFLIYSGIESALFFLMVMPALCFMLCCTLLGTQSTLWMSYNGSVSWEASN